MWLIALKGLSSNGKSTPGRFTPRTGKKQATGEKKLPLQDATDLQQIFTDTHHASRSPRPHAPRPANTPLHVDSSPVHQPSHATLDRHES
jgi:hypothetical protein